MIGVQDLTYAYVRENPMRFPDFAVARGEHCLLLGESGSGKTTLLHLLGGLLRSSKGNIMIDGTDITKLDEPSLDHFRGQRVGFIFQKNHLITALSVKKNLLLAPFLAGLAKDEARVEYVLSRLDLKEKTESRIRELSQGQLQRVAIARAVLNRPAMILADEPTSALDDGNCDRVISLLMEVAEENSSTLLVATHDHRLKSKIQRQIVLKTG